MFDLYLSAVIFGLGISGILFLVSIGISIGFGLMRIINMEQMVYYTFGAYMTFALVSTTGSFILGLIAGTLVAATAGFLVETQLLRRVYGKELMFTMVVTFSVFMIGIGLVQYIAGLDSKAVGMPFRVLVHNNHNPRLPIKRLYSEIRSHRLSQADRGIQDTACKRWAELHTPDSALDSLLQSP